MGTSREASQRMRMDFIIIALSSVFLPLTLGSPYPEADANPGLLKVIKTVQIWDDEDQALQDVGLEEDLDINGFNVDYDVDDIVVQSHGLSEEIDLSPVSEKSPQGRDLVGKYVGGRFQPISPDASHNHHHHGHHQSHDHIRHQQADTYPHVLNNNFLDGSSVPDTRGIDLNKLPGAENLPTFDTDDGLTCVKKMMMTEYTEYEETVTCVHKEEKRCHESYVTDFEPTRQRECDQKFEKRCSIYYEDVAVPDEVEVCKTDIAYNCNKKGPEECKTIYDTVCETTRTVHTVEDDVANCQVVQEIDTACVEANKVRDPVTCDTWPRQVCTTSKVAVNRTTPDTKCRQESRELCAKKPCLEETVVQCANETKTVIVSKPKEECDMEPHETCRSITKMVPHLRAVEECVNVPQEVCGTSRAPIKKERPAIMNRCYKPDPEGPSTVTPVTPTVTPVTGTPGEVLLEEIQFRFFGDLDVECPGGLDSCLGDEISVELFGEQTPSYPDGVTCSFTFDDFDSFESTIRNNNEMTINGEENLGGCYRSPLNYQISEGGSVTGLGSSYDWSNVTMCINWLVEANGKKRFPFTCSMVQDAADVKKYNLSCSPKGVCFG